MSKKTITIYEVDFRRRGVPEIVQAQAEVRPKTVKILGEESKAPWGYKETVPLTDIHRTAAEAKTACVERQKKEIERLETKLKEEKSKLAKICALGVREH